MKRFKALLLVVVLSLICVAFSACSTDPKSLNGEEVNRLEWLQAFEYIENGVACEDNSASFTSYGTYNHYEVSSTGDDDDKKLTDTITYTLQVNKKVLYSESMTSDLSYEEAFEENSYIYVDNTEKEQVVYTSNDNVKWHQMTTTSNFVNVLSRTIKNLKEYSYKFNKKTGMYETISSSYGYTRIKFYDKKIVYIKVETDTIEGEFSFTNYGKTEIEIEKPSVEKNKLEIAYNAVKASNNMYTNVTLSNDGTYMDFTYYGGSNDDDLATINNALGLPNEMVVAAIIDTTTLNERKTARENDIIVTWIKTGENYNNSNGGIYKVTYILE